MALPQSALIWSDQYFHWGLLEPGVAAAAQREELERLRTWKRFRVDCRWMHITFAIWKRFRAERQWMHFTFAIRGLKPVAAAVVPTRELAAIMVSDVPYYKSLQKPCGDTSQPLNNHLQRHQKLLNNVYLYSSAKPSTTI